MFGSIKFKLSHFLPRDWFWAMYAPEFYQDRWQHRIFPQHFWLLNIIRKTKPQTILEAGCGFGRNLQFLIGQGIDPKKLTGIDFSSPLLQKARQTLSSAVKLNQGKLQRLPYKKNQFDLVFTHGVLMHLPPSQIKTALGELIRITRSWLILIEEVTPGSNPCKINSFTWSHDYVGLINQYNLKILDQRQDKYHLIWLWLKKS